LVKLLVAQQGFQNSNEQHIKGVESISKIFFKVNVLKTVYLKRAGQTMIDILTGTVGPLPKLN
jgi:hypothetical protein